MLKFLKIGKQTPQNQTAKCRKSITIKIKNSHQQQISYQHNQTKSSHIVNDPIRVALRKTELSGCNICHDIYKKQNISYVIPIKKQNQRYCLGCNWYQPKPKPFAIKVNTNEFNITTQYMQQLLNSRIANNNQIKHSVKLQKEIKCKKYLELEKRNNVEIAPIIVQKITSFLQLFSKFK